MQTDRISTHINPFMLPESYAAHTPVHQSQENYEEVTANLSHEQLKELDDKLSTIPLGYPLEVAYGVLTGELETLALFKDPEFPYYALKALKIGKIDACAFTTSILFYNASFYAAKTNTPIVKISLFDGLSPSTTAWDMVRTSSEDPRDSYEFTLPPSRTQHFFDLCRNLPPLEQQFLLVPEEKPGERTLGLRLKEVNFRALIFYKGCRVIASKGMMQAYLQAQGPSAAPRMITRLGLSEPAALGAQSLRNERDFCLNTLFPVDSADGFPVDVRYNDVENHDFYHASVFRTIPEYDRVRLNAAACLFSKIADQTLHLSKDEQRASDAATHLFDMEHKAYALKTISRDEAFWLSILRCCDKKSVLKAWMQHVLKNSAEYKALGIHLDTLISLRKTVITYPLGISIAEAQELLIECLSEMSFSEIFQKSISFKIDLPYDKKIYNYYADFKNEINFPSFFYQHKIIEFPSFQN